MNHDFSLPIPSSHAHQHFFDNPTFIPLNHLANVDNTFFQFLFF